MRWIALLVVLVGCGKSGNPIIEEHRAKAAPVLAHIKAIGPLVAKEPAVTAATWKLPAGTKLGLHERYSGRRGLGADYNTGVALAPYVEKLCDADWVLVKSKDSTDKVLSILIETSSDWLLNPACYLEKGKAWKLNQLPASQDIEAQLSQLERTRFMAVIRIGEHELPTYAPPGPGEKLSRYNPGRLRGDVLVYEIATEQLVGAFPFDATLPATQEVSDRPLEQLQSALTGVASDTIKAALERAPQ